MAYEFKRNQRIQEEIKIGDTIISINLDLDTISKEFTKRYNSIIAAETELRGLQSVDNAENLNTAMEVYGNAVIQLFSLIFGAEGTEAILKFYENNYFEMSVEVFPFISTIVLPAIQKSIAAQREKLAGQYMQKQTSFKIGRK